MRGQGGAIKKTNCVVNYTILDATMSSKKLQVYNCAVLFYGMISRSRKHIEGRQIMMY